jgi:hypothetical protein
MKTRNFQVQPNDGLSVILNQCGSQLGTNLLPGALYVTNLLNCHDHEAEGTLHPVKVKGRNDTKHLIHVPISLRKDKYFHTSTV